jgi:uroporphyrinogen-III synthase
MHILITRPRENVTYLVDQLEGLGHQVMVDPLINFVSIPKQSLSLPSVSSFEAIVTTSQQAIRRLAHLTPQRDFPLWCVGEESAKIAEELGFKNIHKAEGTAENLMAQLLERIPLFLQKPILHASGDVIRVNITEALQSKGIAAQRLIVYKTREATHFSRETQGALKAKNLNAVLFYSPRTAHIFKKICQISGFEEYCSSLTALCLSEAIKAEIIDLPWKKIQIAKKTSTDALLMILMMAE